MWEQLVGNMPSGTSFFCAFLSALIPYLVYSVNQRIHRYGDPSWMQANAQNMEQGVNAGGQRPMAGQNDGGRTGKQAPKPNSPEGIDNTGKQASESESSEDGDHAGDPNEAATAEQDKSRSDGGNSESSAGAAGERANKNDASKPGTDH